MYFYWFYQIPEDHYEIVKIFQFMAEKQLPFSVSFASQNRNYFLTEKMAKIASNELRFVTEMYFYWLYQIQEDH